MNVSRVNKMQKEPKSVHDAIRFYIRYKHPIDMFEKRLQEFSDGINWDNFVGEDGEYFKAKEALYCKLSWVEDYFSGMLAKSPSGQTDDIEELFDIVKDVMSVITALPSDK